MFLTKMLPTYLNFTDGAIIAVLGYAVVFAGIALLLIVTVLLGKAFQQKQEEKAAPEVVETAPEIPAAPGSAGNLKMHNVPPKTAAILMAIVAEKTGKPLNELRFTSIKEVE